MEAIPCSRLLFISAHDRAVRWVVKGVAERHDFRVVEIPRADVVREPVADIFEYQQIVTRRPCVERQGVAHMYLSVQRGERPAT